MDPPGFGLCRSCATELRRGLAAEWGKYVFNYAELGTFPLSQRRAHMMGMWHPDDGPEELEDEQ